MKCETKNEASRIAYAGLRKMYREGGYTLEAGADATKKFVVKEDGTMYLVWAHKDQPYCDCAFFEENAEFGICKHVAYVREEIRKEANFQSLCETIPANVLRGGI